MGEATHCYSHQDKMQRPFQCIEVLQDKYLIAASGPQLSTVSLKDGREVSQWTAGAAVGHDFKHLFCTSKVGN